MLRGKALSSSNTVGMWPELLCDLIVMVISVSQSSSLGRGYGKDFKLTAKKQRKPFQCLIITVSHIHVQSINLLTKNVFLCNPDDILNDIIDHLIMSFCYGAFHSDQMCLIIHIFRMSRFTLPAKRCILQTLAHSTLYSAMPWTSVLFVGTSPCVYLGPVLSIGCLPYVIVLSITSIWISMSFLSYLVSTFCSVESCFRFVSPHVY